MKIVSVHVRLITHSTPLDHGDLLKSMAFHGLIYSEHQHETLFFNQTRALLNKLMEASGQGSTLMGSSPQGIFARSKWPLKI